MLWSWYNGNDWKSFSFEQSIIIETQFRKGVPSFDLNSKSTIFFSETFILFHEKKMRCAIHRMIGTLSESDKTPCGYIDPVSKQPVVLPLCHRDTVQMIKEAKLFSRFCFFETKFCLDPFIINFDTNMIYFQSGKVAELKRFRCKRKEDETKQLLLFEDSKSDEHDAEFDTFSDQYSTSSEEDEEEDEDEDDENYTFDSDDGWFSKHNIKIRKANSSLTCCSICFCEQTNAYPGWNDLIELKDCQNHAFHYNCLQTWFEKKPDCPVCRKNYGPVFGNQPLNGTMTVSLLPYTLPGFHNVGTIQIDYNFPESVQDFDHPSPGAVLPADFRRAYLPNSEMGQKILGLLKIAWQRRLIFTVGVSLTLGIEGGQRIVWNGIHHKTNVSGAFGFPDDSYFPLVLSELATFGIK